jgi:hypothetical protein
MLLLAFVGSFLLRLAERMLLMLLFHVPPRSTPPASLQSRRSRLALPLIFRQAFQPASQQFSDFDQYLSSIMILALAGQLPRLRQTNIQP